MNAIRRIVVAVDFSEATEEVIQAAITIAGVFHASIDVVYVREAFARPVLSDTILAEELKPVAFAWIDESLSRISARLSGAGLTSVTTSLEGSPQTEIVTHAQKVGADLILVGTHGRGGLSHAILGSVAERVVQKSHCPVLVIPTGANRR